MKYSILAITTLLLMTTMGCKKSLEETPYSTLSTGNVYTSEAGLKQATFGVYQQYLGVNYLYPFYNFVLTEAGQRYSTFGMASAANFVRNYENFGSLPTDEPVRTAWEGMYKVISRANTVIANAPKAVDENTAKAYIAEARLLRAYAYFMLVRLFGDVPLIVNNITGLEQSEDIFGPRVASSKVYSQIVEDLQFAEINLPDKRTTVDIGRVTSGTAKAILGKVYLTMAGKPMNLPGYYQKAVDVLVQLVGSANEAKYGYTLLGDFSSVFSGSNERNSEIILSFSHLWSSTSTGTGSIFPFFLLPTGYGNKDEQNSYGLTKQFYELFENTDTRRDVTLISSYMNQINGRTIKYDLTKESYIDQTSNLVYGIPKCGIAYGKYDRSLRTTGASAPGYNADQIHLRFADVLLMLAEASNEVGAPNALQYLNRVRGRAKAGLLNISDPLLLRIAIRNERRLELTGEFNTVFDIRRWGTLQNEIANMLNSQTIENNLQPYSPKLELYPIPQTELYANPNLVPNPGY